MNTILFLKPLRVCCFLFIVLFIHDAKAQQIRAYDLCDSTVYALNGDTSIIASRYNLYRQTDSDIQLIHEFDMPNPNYYIRDFDIITSKVWYTLIGARTISNSTFLYKSNDSGQNWTIDTSYYMAIDSSITGLIFDPLDPNYYKSINQVQRIGTDTILLFLGYYGSGIVYSVDGGSQWSHWFANSPAHYFGLLECEQSYYLFQMEGDGFQGRMFPFEKQYLFRNDSLVNFDHFPSGSGHHAPFHSIDLPNVVDYSNLSYCEINSFLSNYIDSTCIGLTAIHPILEDPMLNVYPNPNHGQFRMDTTMPLDFPIEMSLYSYSGHKIINQKFYTSAEFHNYQSYANLSAGSYFLVLKTPKSTITKKILVY